MVRQISFTAGSDPEAGSSESPYIKVPGRGTAETSESPYIKVPGGGGAETESPYIKIPASSESPYVKVPGSGGPESPYIKVPGSKPVKAFDSAKSKSKRQRGGQGSDQSDASDPKVERGLKPGEELEIAVIEREEDLRYGWGSYTPSWLQCCCTPRFLLAALMFIGIAQGFFVHGVLSASWPSLHGRFHFSLFELGVIRIMYEVGMIVGFVPVMYFNAQGAKRPLWIGIGCLLMAVGSFTCVLPHFCLDGPLDTSGFTGDKEKYKCVANSSTTNMMTSTDSTSFPFSLLDSSMLWDNDSTVEAGLMGVTDPPMTQQCQEANDVNYFKYIFGVGVFLNGLGAAAYFTMGIAMLDESVSQRTSVLYTGALSSSLLFGVGLGMYVNAQILRFVFVDKWNKEPPAGMNWQSPYWVGAWWLGMLISTALFMLSSVPMFGFPERLPGGTRAQIQDVMDADLEPAEDMDAKAVVQSVWKSVVACLTNFTYLGLVAEQTAYMAVITSFTTFMPMYLRVIYGVPGKAAGTMAGLVVLAGLVGCICGTAIQRRFRMSILGILRFSLVATMGMLVCLGAIFIRCPFTEFAGVTAAYPVISSYEVNMIAECNSDCKMCSKDDHRPYCYRGKSPSDLNNAIVFKYFSPCYAGCTEEGENGTSWTNCGCAPKDDDFNGGGSISLEDCDLPECWYRAAAVTLAFAWCAFLVFVRLTPLQQCLLRSISFKNRVVGLTMSAFISRILGAIPAPVIMGVMMSEACEVYKTLCNKKAGCLWRNEDMIHKRFSISAYATCGVGIFGLALAYFHTWKLNTTAKPRVKTERTKTKRKKDKIEPVEHEFELGEE